MASDAIQVHRAKDYSVNLRWVLECCLELSWRVEASTNIYDSIVSFWILCKSK
jgi:hypothetical protein